MRLKHNSYPKTVARGYRLKVSTHRLINKVKVKLNLSHEKIISKAIKEYYIKKLNLELK